MNNTYDASIRIRDLPRQTHKTLTMIASAKAIPLWEAVRDALVEYVEKHKGVVADHVRRS